MKRQEKQAHTRAALIETPASCSPSALNGEEGR
jgi:hypothetical protein